MTATVSKRAKEVAKEKGWPTIAVDINGSTANPQLDSLSFSGAISREEYDDIMQAITRILQRIDI
jgi:hypothetical protein